MTEKETTTTALALASRRDQYNFVEKELKKTLSQLANVIPPAAQAGGLTPRRAVGIVLDSLYRDPKLLDCTPPSLVRSVMQASEIGLELGSAFGEAFIVPFKDSKAKCTKATMMVGYKGFVRLIRGNPRVTIVKSVLVYSADKFAIDEGENRLTHVPSIEPRRKRGTITHAYSRVYYSDGSSQFEVMDRDELDEIRTTAIGRSYGRSTPWKTHPEEMFKKCPLRRQAKWLELTHLAKRGLELDDENAIRRGEVDALVRREGFDSGRAGDLKDMLKVSSGEAKPATDDDAAEEVIDADFEEVEGES